MPFQRVPNTVQVDALFRLFGQTVENVFHIECPTGVDAATIVDCATIVHNWIQGNYIGMMTTDVSYIGVEAKNLDIEGGGTHFIAPETPVIGIIASSTLPGGSSLCISLKTAQSGRSHRGRKYMFGLPESSQSGNQMNTAYVEDAGATFGALITAIEDANKFLVVVSRFLEGVLRLEAVVTRVIAAVGVDVNIDSQRRRLTGRGA
jgi:hypothetical protein